MCDWEIEEQQRKHTEDAEREAEETVQVHEHGNDEHSYPSAPAFAPEHDERGENALAFVREHDAGRENAQAVGQAQARDMSFEEFYGALREIIDRHIDNAALRAAEEHNEDLWGQIKAAFGIEKNKKLIVGKVLAGNTPGVSDDTSPSSVKERFEFYIDQGAIKQTVLTAFEFLDVPIGQTLNDIYYWMSAEKASKITKIILTDSDIHTRGVGVCMVGYKTGSFFGRWIEKEKLLVIKPEDKSFEKAVYGKSGEGEESSLAEEFHHLLQEGGLGAQFKESKIGTLDIRTSPENEYGSAVEFFEHRQFEEIADKQEIDVRSVESHIAFASLLGLADLHKENAVYSRGSSPKMQFIDAEIGMKYFLERSEEFAPLQTAINRGEMGGANPSVKAVEMGMQKEDFEHYDAGQMDGFLDVARERLRSLSSRIVIIPTENLFAARSAYLAGNEIWAQGYLEELRDGLGIFQSSGIQVDESVDWENSNPDESDALKAAKADFEKGRIPFYEIRFETGQVIHKSDPEVEVAVFRGPSGEDFLEAMIESRKQMLREHQP